MNKFLLLLIIPTLGLSACGTSDEDDGASYSKIESNVEFQCGGKVREIITLDNGQYGTTSAYLILCRDGSWIHVDD